MVLKYLLAPFSIQSVKVTFCLFQSLCSSDDVYRPISSPYISTCTACSALLFGPNMYLPNTYKPYKKRTCLMRINRVITVLPISRPNFHRVQCKIDDPFSSGRLAPIPLTSLSVCRHWWSAHAHVFAAPSALSFACYRRKTIYLWNVWRPILHVPFYWPLPYFAGLLVWIRATNVLNFSQIGRQISELLRVKILDIPHQLWTAYLSQMRPSPIGMKPVPDERPGAMSHWGNWSKILRASFSSSGRWKLIFSNVWPLITY